MKKEEQKQVVKFRVKIGDNWGLLDYQLHEKGALIKTPAVKNAHVFNRLMDANFAIERTTIVKRDVARSFNPDWPKFAPLKYTESMVPESFVVEDES